jgi:hypothetical protein
VSAAMLPEKAARNEQRKLQAKSVNAIGLAFSVFGVVQPIVGTAKVAICAAIGYMFHKQAERVLAAMED